VDKFAGKMPALRVTACHTRGLIARLRLRRKRAVNAIENDLCHAS
jgi:hypothetical protein